jgi:hypothetical protein
VKRQLDQPLTAGAGKREKSAGRFNVLLDNWLKPLICKPVKTGWRVNFICRHAINRVANCRFAESRVHAAETKIA